MDGVTAPSPRITCRSRWPGRDDVVVDLDLGGSLYASLRAGGRPIASACTGDAVCGRCTVRILAGEVTPMGDDERRVLEQQGAEPGERLACLTQGLGDVVVGTDYW